MLFLAAILFIPLVQQRLQIFDVAPLGGYYTVPEKPLLNKSTWLDGSFAEGANAYFDFNLGFRPWLIRCRNTFYYWILNSSGQYDFVVGKNRNIFYNNNVYSATGKDFVGKEFISKRIEKLDFVASKLKERGIKLFVVIAPGKANLYTADFPLAYKPADSIKTNYYWLRNSLKQSNLKYIDFHKQYNQLKNTTSYPLFSNASLHWSTYHYMHSWDSILHFMNAMGGKTVSDFVFGPVIKSDSASLQEMDQLPGMNVFGLLEKQTYYYPKYSYKNIPDKKAKALFISDSFFLTFLANNITNDAMDAQCWFYHREIYPQSYTKQTTLNDIDYWGEFFKNDYVCIMMSEVTWGQAGFEFADKAFNYFTDELATLHADFDGSVMNQYAFISNDAGYRNLIEAKAKENKISFNRMAYLDALYLIGLQSYQQTGNDTSYQSLIATLSNHAYITAAIAAKDSSYATGSSVNYIEAFAKYLASKHVSKTHLDSLLQLKATTKQP